MWDVYRGTSSCLVSGRGRLKGIVAQSGRGAHAADFPGDQGASKVRAGSGGCSVKLLSLESGSPPALSWQAELRPISLSCPLSLRVEQV